MLASRSEIDPCAAFMDIWPSILSISIIYWNV